MSNKLFRSLRYVKNKPVEISVGISPEEAAQDNVGDDKAKLVFTTDRRIFLNGEEIARTKGDERPKPIVNKAIPRYPMKGSRYVVRWSKAMKTFKLNFVVSGKIASSEEEQIDLTNLDAEVVRIFGEENISGRFITIAATSNDSGYISLPWQLSTTVNNTYDGDIKVLVQYLVDIQEYEANFFVLKVNTNEILSSPNFEKEINNTARHYHPKIENEPCASPDYAIMNGNLFCIKMPNAKDRYAYFDKLGFDKATNKNKVYRFRRLKCYVPFEKIGKQSYKDVERVYKINAWVCYAKKRMCHRFNKAIHRFYGLKKHGTCREQSIHFVEMNPDKCAIKK